MVTMSVSAARERLPEAVEAARTEAVVLERYGRPAAVLLSPERYAELQEALEEAEDVAAFDEALQEEGPNSPWAQLTEANAAGNDALVRRPRRQRRDE